MLRGTTGRTGVNIPRRWKMTCDKMPRPCPITRKNLAIAEPFVTEIDFYVLPVVCTEAYRVICCPLRLASCSRPLFQAYDRYLNCSAYGIIYLQYSCNVLRN